MNGSGKTGNDNLVTDRIIKKVIRIKINGKKNKENSKKKEESIFCTLFGFTHEECDKMFEEFSDRNLYHFKDTVYESLIEDGQKMGMDKETEIGIQLEREADRNWYNQHS